MSSRRLLPGLTLAALLAVPAAASATDPPPPGQGAAAPSSKAEALKLAADGRKALKEKRFPEAAQALQRSNELDPSPQLRLELAEALTGAGKLLEASRALHAVADAPANPATAKIQETAKATLAQVEPRIPWLQIEVIGPDDGTAAAKVDGVEVDASNEIPLNPGDHKVQISAEGFEPAEKTVTLEEGAHQKKRIKLHKAGAVAASDPKAKETPSSSGGSSSSSILSPDNPKFPAVAALGVGGLGLIVGSITGLVAVSKAGSARKFCTGTACSPAAADDINSSKTAGTVSTVGFILAGVGAAAGVTLFFVLPDAKRAEPARPMKDTTTDTPAKDTKDKDGTDKDGTDKDGTDKDGTDKEPKAKDKDKGPKAKDKDKDNDAWIAPYIGFGQAGLRGVF